MSDEAKYQLLQSQDGESTSKNVQDIDETVKCCCWRVMTQKAYFYVVVLIMLVLFVVLSVTLAVLSQNYHPSKSNNDGLQCIGKSKNVSMDKNDSVLAKIATNGHYFPYHSTRLPRSIHPLRYEMYLNPDYAKLITHGQIKIWIHCLQQTNFILLHIKDIEIHSVQVQDSNSERINITNTLENTYNDFYYIQLENMMDKDMDYNISMDFSSKISIETLQGFYRASYQDSTGNRRFMYVTQFEAASARSAFPCFDEPSMKARFSLTIVRPRDYKALSNMQMKERINLQSPDNAVAVRFEESVPMSTYLVAFAVCDYAYAQDHAGKILVRTWAPAEKINHTRTALEASVKIIPYYSGLFYIPYPLNKLDLIAVPDFSAGAMENWGLITFRETALLYNAKYGSIDNRHSVISTVCHEIAHQWFGNLVTMQWWQDLWLNEGFATFIEHKGVDIVAPELDLEGIYLSELLPAMNYDSYVNSHPLLQPVSRPTEIGALFDKISYSKGASILNMLEAHLGSEIFFQGLRRYLRKYQYSNAESDDLWNIFSLKSTMDTWIRQAGFPLLTVSYEATHYTISQERFFIASGKANLKNNATKTGILWNIPITYIDQNGLRKKTIMTGNDLKVHLNNKNKWVKLNPKQNGYYRVNYDEENWRSLITQLQKNHSVLHSVDRAGLLDDSFYLNRADVLNITIFLNMTKYLRQETSYVPLRIGIPKIAAMLSIVGPDKADRQNVQKYLRYLIEPQLQRLGMEDKGNPEKIHIRKILLTMASAANIDSVVQNITKRFQQWLSSEKSLPIESKTTYIRIGITKTGSEEWEALLRKYLDSNDAYSKKLYINGLAQTRNKTLLQRLLDMCQDNNKVPKSEVMNVIAAVSGNGLGSEMAWKFVTDRWDYFINTYSGDLFLMADMIDAIVSNCKDEVLLTKVKNFFQCHDDAGTGKLVISEAIEKVEDKFQWHKKIANSTKLWFQNIQSEIKR